MPEPTTTTPPTPPSAGSPPAASSTPAVKSGVGSFFDETASELDALDKAPPPAPKKEGKESPPTKPSAKTAEQTSPKKPTSTTTETEDSTAGTATSKETTPPPTAEDKIPAKVPELRAAYETLKKEHKALKTEHEKLKTAKPAEDPEKKTLVESLEARDKRIKELEEEVKFSNFEKSEEFQEKYQKPFEEAYVNGRQMTASLTVTDAEGNTRKGTAEDFDHIMSIPDHAAANKRAKELFGDDFNLVMNERRAVIDINNRATRAKAEFQKTASDRMKAAVENRAKQEKQVQEQRQQQAATFSKFVSEDAEKHGDWFKPVDGDEEGNRMLEKGRALANAIYSREKPLPVEQVIRNDAWAYNAIVGFPRMAFRLKKATAELAQLKEELSKYKASESAGGGTRRGQTEKPMSDEDELEQLDKMG